MPKSLHSVYRNINESIETHLILSFDQSLMTYDMLKSLYRTYVDEFKIMIYS